MARTTIDHKKIAETQQKVWSAHMARVKNGYKKIVQKQAECYEQQLVDKDSKHAEETAHIIEKSKSKLAKAHTKKLIETPLFWKICVPIVIVLFASVWLNVSLFKENRMLKIDGIIVEYFLIVGSQGAINEINKIRSDVEHRNKTIEFIREHKNINQLKQ